MNVTEREAPQVGETIGARVRRLRLSRGLTQAQVAGPTLTGSHVSLVESGRRRPSPEAVAALASRLGTTPAYLIDGRGPGGAEDDVDLADAEVALAAGDPAAAAVFRRVAENGGTRQARRRALVGLAGALSQARDAAGAVAVLEALLSGTRPDDADPTWAAVLANLCEAYSGSGEPSSGVAVGEPGLARLGADQGSDAVRLGLAVAGCHLQVGGFVRARELSGVALASAAPADTAVAARARLAEARALLGLGETGLARASARDAVGLSTTGSDESAAAAARLLLCQALLAGPDASPEEVLHLSQSGGRGVSPDPLLLLAGAQASLLLQDPGGAEVLAREAIELAGRDPVVGPAAYVVLAGAAAARHLADAAVAHARAAVASLRPAVGPWEAAALLGAAADVFLAWGDASEAADTYRSALRVARVMP